MSYVLRIPQSPAFVTKGLRGYQFGPLRNPELDIHYLDVKTGHDTLIISKNVARTYYT